MRARMSGRATSESIDMSQLIRFSLALILSLLATQPSTQPSTQITGIINAATATTISGSQITDAITTATIAGAQPANTDVLAGRVDLMFDNTTTVRPMIKDGRVKAIATTGASRDALLPGIPTCREAGVEGLVLEGWVGLFASAKTPRLIVEQLRAAVAKVKQDPEVRARLESNGWRIMSLSAMESDAFVKSEAQRWLRFIRQAGIRGE